MQIKALTIETMDETGTGLARLGIMSAIDSDGDTYAPGAFGWKDGGHQWASLVPSHNRAAMPFGKARVFEEDGVAFAELKLNLETQTGSDWHKTLMFDMKTGRPVQEWSYGYNALEWEHQLQDGRKVRLLKKLDVHEVSPVLRGAGIGSGTVAIKSAELKPENFDATIAQLQEMKAALEARPDMLSETGRKQLGDVHAEIAAILAAGEKALAPDEAANAAAQRFAEHLVRGVAW